jgi:tetratricopeptide (TPR) repeat protein
VDSPAPSHFSASRWPAIGALVLVIAGIAAYSNAFSVPFVLDDTVSIVDNESIRSLWPIGPVLSPPEDAGVGGRPLANLSFALNYALGGTNVRGYHIVNLAIHLAAALLLFGLVRRTLGAAMLAPRFREETRAPLALVVALLWLLHPLQTEAVTYVSQRTESLMAFFYLLTLYAFVRLAEAPSRGWWAIAVGAGAGGMATKEVMVTAPLIVLLFDRTLIAGSFRAAWQRRRWFYLTLAATWLVLVFHLSGIAQRGVTYATVTWWQYALTESTALVTYLQLAFWPAPLVFDYGTEFPVSFGGTAGPAAVILALLAGATLALRFRPPLGLAGAWFFVLLAPTSSFIPIAGQPIAEHRMYLPLAGLICAIALPAVARFGRAALAALVSLAAFYGVLTHERNFTYQSAENLWRDTIAKRPDNARAHAALGAALLRQNQLPAAIVEFGLALKLQPNDATTHNNLATALQDAGRSSEAIAHYQASARLEPNAASTFYNLGNALLDAGRSAQAITALERALALKPNLAVAHAALANAFVATNRPAEALVHYTEALRLDPTLAPAHFALANLLAGAGRFSDALPHYEATLKAYPNVPEAQYNFATALAMTSHTTAAITHYEIALRLKPDFAAARDNLAKLRGATPTPR